MKMGSNGGAPSPSVCIVGAGMTGLVACRQLLRHGVQPLVLESSPDLGGLWQHTFASTKLQTPAPAFQFSDFPWPPSTPPFPSHSLVLRYFQNYAHHFHLLPFIRFHSKVVKIIRLSRDRSAETGSWGLAGKPSAFFGSPCQDPVWEVHVQSTHPDDSSSPPEIQKLRFHFVVLCVGRFGDVPLLPSLPPGKGPEVFRGKVLHSMDYGKLEDEEAFRLLQDQRVVVVGFAKSALDVAAEAAKANEGNGCKPCTLVYRTAHWLVAHYEPWGVSLGLLYMNRLSELLIPKPNQGFLLSIVSTILSPARWAISKFVESYLLWSQPMRKYGVVPQHSFYEQISSCTLSTLPESFYEQVDKGRIRIEKSPNWCFSEKGVILDNGSEVEADVVILATGYRGEAKLDALLPSPYKENLLGDGKVVPLYRGIIHPRVPDLAILGYQESLTNLRTSEMGARWVAKFLSGQFQLPDIKAMEEETKSWIEYMKNATPFYHRACIGVVHAWHSDQLCKDIGWKPQRKSKWLQDWLEPYTNADYVD